MAHLIACPECKKQLQVPDTLLGKKVQCPECKNAFTVSVPEDPDEKIGLTAKAPSSIPVQKPAKEKELSTLDDDQPVKKKKRRFEDEDSDRRDDDEDHDDDLPKRRRRIARGVPHRGGMILAFGLIGLVGGMSFILPAVFGIVAWIMGNNDMREIRSGRMDSEGESMTQAGRICGIIGTAIGGLWVLFFIGYFCCIFAVLGVAINANKNMPPPQPRFNMQPVPPPPPPK